LSKFGIMEDMRFRILFASVVFLISLVFTHSSGLAVFAQDCGADLDCQIGQIQKEIDALSPAQENNKKELADLNSRITNIKKQIVGLSQKLTDLEKDISKREEELAYTQEIFEEKTSNHYKFLRTYDPILPFLYSDSASNAFREIIFRQRAIDDDRSSIEKYANELLQLKKDKESLEKNKTSLASAQANLDKQAKFLGAEVAKVDAYLATLSAKQQELLAAKFASAPVPLLAYTSLGGCSSDIGKSSNFSGKKFGFFSLGVPNKTGLNQYGAKGRAEGGQSYEQILNAYYNNFQIVDYGTGFNITVNGTNPYNQSFNNESYNIEDYLKHLYEMPATWDSKALQAQAIAARSYALARTNKGQSSIPPDESGQVVKKEPNDPLWVNAVIATVGKVMVQNGNPISAWYSSTHGGVILKSSQIGWSDTPWTKQGIDTPSGTAGSISDLKSNAFDKQSPWFYCDWGYRSQYNNTAWLKEEETVDIVNAYVLWDLDNNMITHLSQTDKPTSDTWSPEQVKQEILNKGGNPINTINSISAAWDGSGISKTISVNGRSFDAQKIKNLFNIRAPANIQIKPACQPNSSLSCDKMYALYDIVQE